MQTAEQSSDRSGQHTRAVGSPHDGVCFTTTRGARRQNRRVSFARRHAIHQGHHTAEHVLLFRDRTKHMVVVKRSRFGTAGGPPRPPLAPRCSSGGSGGVVAGGRHGCVSRRASRCLPAGCLAVTRGKVQRRGDRHGVATGLTEARSFQATNQGRTFGASNDTVVFIVVPVLFFGANAQHHTNGGHTRGQQSRQMLPIGTHCRVTLHGAIVKQWGAVFGGGRGWGSCGL